ncbi:MAG: hypothetical protein KQA34_02010 [Candidatus Aenigmarchaeota archaeon]|nr:hypothetical protein [Candidatus Aenigmarchaeota archaeon]
MEIFEEDIKLKLNKLLNKKSFYNPQMKIVRNLNIEIYKNFAKENYKFLDLLASIGANSIRIKKSIPYLEVYSNDVSREAIEYLKLNAKINDVKINILNENAKNLKCKLNEKFNIIDIDPFGSPISFFPYILDFLSKETLLSLTATDIATLAGKYSDKCLMRYGIFCYENDMEREIAIRNLISETINFFSAFEYISNVVFSFSEKHFAKVYIILKKSSIKKIEKNLRENINFISFCKACLNKKIGIHEKCEICNEKFSHFGPTYIGKLFDEKYIEKSIKNVENPEVRKIFEKALNDIAEDYTIPPISFNTHLLAKKLKTNVKSINFLIQKLKEKNLKASKSYLDSKSIRTSYFEELIKIFKNS